MICVFALEGRHGLSVILQGRGGGIRTTGTFVAEGVLRDVLVLGEDRGRLAGW